MKNTIIFNSLNYKVIFVCNEGYDIAKLIYMDRKERQ